MRILVTAMLSAFIFLSISCEKEKDDSRNRRFISLKLDNRVYLAENPTGTITPGNVTDENPDNDYPTMTITGTSINGDNFTLTLAAPVAFVPGVYPATKKGNGMVVMLTNNYYSALTSVGSTDFSITISNLDSRYVEGTFSGTLTDASGVGGPRAIKDGAFRAIVTVKQGQ